MGYRFGFLLIIITSVSLTACPANRAPVAQPAPVSATFTSTPDTSTVTPAASSGATLTPVAADATAAAHFAWPASLPPTHQLQPAQSTITADELHLELINPTDAQDYIVIQSVPDSGEGFGGPCTETVMVRGDSGVICNTGAGATVQWVEQGWRYSVGGGLMSSERALEIAEMLEFVDLATAEERLQP